MLSRKSWFVREGRTLISVVILIMLLLHGVWGALVTPLWLPVLLLMWSLREPYRTVPSAPLAIVSPVDGELVSVAEVTDPFLKRPALCYSIRMPWTGGYTLRSVIEGKIQEHWFGASATGTAYTHTIWIRTDEADDIVVAMQPGRWFGRIACYISTGERVGQGQRCGFIPLGTTRVDVFLPLSSNSEAQPGHKLKAGESILGRLIHS